MKSKDIPGYPNYFVTDEGDVYSRDYRRYGTIQKLKPGLGKRGYLLVSLWNDGKAKTFTIHRLVANAFIPNPDDLPQINHEDFIKINNNVDNLEWCNNSYNHIHSFKCGRIPIKGEGHGSHKLTEQEVIEIRFRYIKGIVGAYLLAEEYDVVPTTIYDIVKNQTWKHI